MLTYAHGQQQSRLAGPAKVCARTTSTTAKETVCSTTVAGVEYLQAQHARPEMEDPRVNHLVIASIVFACVFGSTPSER
jgi:hypothetical protein